MFKMTDQEIRDALIQGYELLIRSSATIAALPLEDWLQAIEIAEAAGPIVDPTLYRDYLHSPKSKIIKDVILAAIPLKRVIKEARNQVISNPEKFVEDKQS